VDPGAPLHVVTVPALDALSGLLHGFERRREAAATESREESRERVAEALRREGRLLLLRQVHGAAVARAPWPEPPEADAAVATEAGQLLGIETADCLPVLIVVPERRTAAAAHAGWRGTAAGVVERTVDALRRTGSRPAALVAALGPSIGPCCYEVGEDVRAAFGPAGAAFLREGPRGRPHLDVRAGNVRQLLRAGLRPENLHHVADCTFCRPDLYHSYRRDGPGRGRMISYVGWVR
jgi:polyphenol oxidase